MSSTLNAGGNKNSSTSGDVGKMELLNDIVVGVGGTNGMRVRVVVEQLWWQGCM